MCCVGRHHHALLQQAAQRRLQQTSLVCSLGAGRVAVGPGTGAGPLAVPLAPLALVALVAQLALGEMAGLAARALHWQGRAP